MNKSLPFVYLLISVILVLFGLSAIIAPETTPEELGLSEIADELEKTSK